jgi:hypothetical protein
MAKSDAVTVQYAKTLTAKWEATLWAEVLTAFPDSEPSDLEDKLRACPEYRDYLKRAAMLAAAAITEGQHGAIPGPRPGKSNKGEPPARRPSGGRIDGDRFINREGTSEQVFGSWLNEEGAA